MKQTYAPSTEAAQEAATGYEQQRVEIAEFAKGESGNDVAKLLATVAKSLKEVNHDVRKTLRISDYQQKQLGDHPTLLNIMAVATNFLSVDREAGLVSGDYYSKYAVHDENSKPTEIPQHYKKLLLSKGSSVNYEMLKAASDIIDEAVKDRSMIRDTQAFNKLSERLLDTRDLLARAAKLHEKNNIIDDDTAINAKKAIRIIDEQLIPALEGTPETPGMQAKIDAFITRAAYTERHANEEYIKILDELKPKAPVVEEPVAADPRFVPEPKPVQEPLEIAHETHTAQSEGSWIKKAGVTGLVALAGAGARDLMDNDPVLTRPFRGQQAQVQSAGEGEIGWRQNLVKGPQHPAERGDANSKEGGRTNS